ncbi:UTRA domain-containing protein [Kribbella sindirgiensis]|uniref:UTRA domain-containing protein n=1 Tax=Kribbella sindirgiensis TaxID=1124744 RepID=UPI001EDF5668|nr:UTRA domain-containing protein [Kribbella sindirgiensis]
MSEPPGREVVAFDEVAADADLAEQFKVAEGDPVIATPREAELLKATQSLPMLLLRRNSRDTAGEPIEVVRSLYRGDRVGFRATLRP